MKLLNQCRDFLVINYRINFIAQKLILPTIHAEMMPHRGNNFYKELPLIKPENINNKSINFLKEPPNNYVTTQGFIDKHINTEVTKKALKNVYDNKN